MYSQNEIVNRSTHQIELKKIYLCSNPIRRLQGIFFRKDFHDGCGVLLTPCSSVHSFGLRRTLDVIFLDNNDLVLSVKTLPPNSVQRCRKAHHVLELNHGCAKNLNIEVGQRLVIGSGPVSQPSRGHQNEGPDHRQTGASMVEFLFIAPVILFLGLGIIQLGLAYHARNVLSYATFEAARTGAVAQADMKAMKKELAYRLGPIFGGDGTASSVHSSVKQASQFVFNESRTQVRILNPTSAAFQDFGVKDKDSGQVVLPNEHLQFRSTDVGASSGVTIQDANLLKIEVTIGFEPKLPWLNVKLPGVDTVLKQLMVAASPHNASFYAQGYIPLRAVATVRMQSRAVANNVATPSALPARSATPSVTLTQNSTTSQQNSITDGSIDSTQPANNSIEQPPEDCIGPNGLPNNMAIESISDEESSALCLAENHSKPSQESLSNQRPSRSSSLPC